MKALAWQKFFSDQRARHGKVVFSAAELANVARTSLHNLNTELGRLLDRGLIARYAQGRYGPAEGVRPEDIVAAVDPGAYLTGFYALFRHHLVTQVPAEMLCFTNRRHNRKIDRSTPTGKLRFVRVPEAIYARPVNQVLASAEQALCDFVWLNWRNGLDPRSLVTFRNMTTLHRRRLNRILRNYPPEVTDIVRKIAAV
jgi:hypothetical protein